MMDCGWTFRRSGWHLKSLQHADALTSLCTQKTVLYCDSRPLRKRSIATSLSAFQNKKLGSFKPHWT